MEAIKFAFKQREMAKMINTAKEDEVLLVSILSAKETPASESKLFLAAQVGNPATNLAVRNPKTAPAVGCPTPPGWKTVVPAISHAQLKNTPKFVISAADKKMLLVNNSGRKDELLASLEGFIAKRKLQTKLSFSINAAAAVAPPTVDGRVI